MTTPKSQRRIIPRDAQWILLLILPLIIILFGSDIALWQRISGAASLFLFAACYVALVGRPPHLYDLEFGRWCGWRSLLRANGWLLAGVVCSTVVAIVTVHWAAAYLLAFLCAIILFSTPRSIGIPVVGAAIALIAGGSILMLATTSVSPDGLSQLLGNSLGGASVVLARNQAGNSMQRLVTERQLAEVTQREAIARDVHDILGHTLTVLTLKAEVAKRLIRADPDAADRELGDILELSRTALADVRTTVQGLHPPDFLTQLALSTQRLELAGITVSVRGDFADSEGNAPELLRQQTLAWALREATTNILRHAQASEVSIDYSPTHLRIIDDGIGWNPVHTPQGTGIAGLHTRTHTAGAQLAIEPVDPHGTSVEVRWPESRRS